MSIIRNPGIKQALTATERGWETYDGKLKIASHNLLSNRIAKNIATPEEIKRWCEGQLIDIEDRQNKILAAREVNEGRLKNLNDKFEATPAVSKLTGANQHIAYLQRKIEHLKVVAEYEKSFANLDAELEKLNIRKEKIQTKLNTILSVIPKLTELVSEQKVVSSEQSAPIEQKDKSDKLVQPKEKQVLQKKKKRQYGPLKGWKIRKAAAEAEAARLAAEAEAAKAVVPVEVEKKEQYQTFATNETSENVEFAPQVQEAPPAPLPGYPVPPAEIIND